MQEPQKPIIVVKVGTNVLSLTNGQLDLDTIRVLVEQLKNVRDRGYRVVLVSSGAIGSGKAFFQRLGKKLHCADEVEERQVLASVGQLELMQMYKEMFLPHRVEIAQVLATKADFLHREHYLNMRRCLLALLRNDVLPILNENDTVAVSELMFTDNDELAGLVATMLKADKLVVLTNVDGLYTGHPADAKSTLIAEVKVGDTVDAFVAATKSQFGRGGMQTKLDMAMKLAKMGIAVHVANGKHAEVLSRIVRGDAVGTHFVPKAVKSSVKRWLGFSESLAQAKVVVNKKAEDVLHSEDVVSLLPVGIVRYEGEFKEGDLVKIMNESGEQIGVGKAEYSSIDLRPLLLKKGAKAFIHYDYMFIQ